MSSVSARLMRRVAVALAVVAGLIGGAVGTIRADSPQRPILFVHGDGDSAALWTTIIWRFESAGYDSHLLFAVDLPHPLHRDDDTKPQVNRSSTTEAATDLGAMVTRVLQTTGQDKLILIGNSRGGNEIRNYLRNFGGAAHVTIAILGGTPNHGVYSLPFNENMEFNGMGPFLKGLNAGSEIVPGVAFFTIRSDTNDKYAQPLGTFLGFPEKPTNVAYQGPELKGATNIVLDGIDHRETAYHKRAFREEYKAIMGKDPASVEITPEAHPVLNGMISGSENGAPTNLPLVGAKVTVYEVDPTTGERKGAAVHQQTVGADGAWGPLTAKPDAYYEWVIAAE